MTFLASPQIRDHPQKNMYTPKPTSEVRRAEKALLSLYGSVPVSLMKPESWEKDGMGE